MPFFELNLDGLPGPTHHFGGLGYGNRASKANANSVSSPLRAGLQAIEKLKRMVDLGGVQGVLPPHPRPVALANGQRIYSSSAMWTANAATVTAARDSTDRRVHFTPANLVSNLHRAVETPFTTRLLRTLFADPSFFVVHDPVVNSFPDEGAANWTRLQGPNGNGLYIAVYGRSVGNPTPLPPTVVPRQSREALEWIISQHGLDPSSVLMVQQAPAAVESGVFHNDVIATGFGELMMMHELAYTVPFGDIEAAIRNKLPSARVIEFLNEELSLSDAVDSYWFNSQWVQTPDGRLVMIAPDSCRQLPRRDRLERRVLDAGVSEIQWMDLSESLKNGGGPACVRLRVPLDDGALASVHSGVIMNLSRLTEISSWMKRWYRDTLSAAELDSPVLHQEACDALCELGYILNLAELFNDPYNLELKI
jgi:succinylarginine dihydrolase